GEAAVRALPGGRGAASADEILARARAIARRLDDPETEAFVSGAAGIIAAVSGRWNEGIELCRRSDEIYRTRCTGARWNIDTVQYFMFSLLTIRGDLREASRRLPKLLKEADELGDLYASTSLRTWAYPVWMAADEIELGRREVRDAIATWPTSGYHVQHFGAVLSETMFDLYLGDGPSAWRRVREAWPDFVRSRLLHQQLLRLTASALRATAAIAAAMHDDTPASERPTLLREASRLARRLDRERKGWAAPLATLTRASVAQLEGHPARALSLLASAEASFEAANMGLYAACTRRVRGQQLRGDEGDALVSSTEAYMQRENVVSPERMVASIAPAFVS
ncbi:MAG: hypothetical protein KC503_33185, partial [Myxococcales bacterium]|nr:hypothetical protein [Myxococcales bacterium]